MKKNIHFSTSKLHLFLMLLAMVLFVSCGSNSKKDRYDDEEEDETEALAEDEDDDADADEDDDAAFTAEMNQAFNDGKPTVSKLFDVLASACINADVDEVNEKLTEYGFELLPDVHTNMEGEEYVSYIKPGIGDIEMGANESLGLWFHFVPSDSENWSEDLFFEEAKSRGYEGEDMGEYTNGIVTIRWQVDGFLMYKNH